MGRFLFLKRLRRNLRYRPTTIVHLDVPLTALQDFPEVVGVARTVATWHDWRQTRTAIAAFADDADCPVVS
ncbi:MAG: hypothetical protein VYE68_08000 [Acidobacteriota bacterium]|nr:hypothetical protein [Acidobacteriota bacterium]